MIRLLEDSKLIMKFLVKNRSLFLDNLAKVKDMELFSEKFVQQGKAFGYYNPEEQLSGIILGYMNDDKTKKAFVSVVLVSEKYSGQGIATKLIEYFEKKALDNGMEEVGITVLKNNDCALHVYQKRGFKIMNEDIYRYILNKRLVGE